jgi:hypothetical protein
MYLSPAVGYASQWPHSSDDTSSWIASAAVLEGGPFSLSSSHSYASTPPPGFHSARDLAASAAAGPEERFSSSSTFFRHRKNYE